MKVVSDHSVSPAEAERRLAEKEALTDPLLTSLDTAYTRINGKHLLFHIHKITKPGVSKDIFFYLLGRAVKRTGLHEDIKAIMERILA